MRIRQNPYRALNPLWLLLIAVSAIEAAPQQRYELLLKGGHVIDSQNGIDAPRDVAISQGKIAAVADAIPASQAETVVNVSGLYVVPGLIDLHTHLYATSGMPQAWNIRHQRHLYTIVPCERAIHQPRGILFLACEASQRGTGRREFI